MSAAEAAHFNMHYAKTHLSRIIERVERGEEIIIDRAGTPVARIVPQVRRVNRTAIGSLAGQLDLTGDSIVAISEGMTLVSRDPSIALYKADTLTV